MYKDTPSTYWNHRLIEHRYREGEDVWVEVHEIHYEDGKPWAFATKGASPQSKWEAEKILAAFDKPIVAWVNEDTAVTDEHGFRDYPDYGWFAEEKFWKEEEDDGSVEPEQSDLHSEQSSPDGSGQGG